MNIKSDFSLPFSEYFDSDEKTAADEKIILDFFSQQVCSAFPKDWKRLLKLGKGFELEELWFQTLLKRQQLLTLKTSNIRRHPGFLPQSTLFWGIPNSNSLKNVAEQLQNILTQNSPTSAPNTQTQVLDQNFLTQGFSTQNNLDSKTENQNIPHPNRMNCRWLEMLFLPSFLPIIFPFYQQKTSADISESAAGTVAENWVEMLSFSLKKQKNNDKNIPQTAKNGEICFQQDFFDFETVLAQSIFLEDYLLKCPLKNGTRRDFYSTLSFLFSWISDIQTECSPMRFPLLCQYLAGDSGLLIGLLFAEFSDGQKILRAAKNSLKNGVRSVLVSSGFPHSDFFLYWRPFLTLWIRTEIRLRALQQASFFSPNDQTRISWGLFSLLRFIRTDGSFVFLPPWNFSLKTETKPVDNQENDLFSETEQPKTELSQNVKNLHQTKKTPLTRVKKSRQKFEQTKKETENLLKTNSLLQITSPVNIFWTDFLKQAFQLKQLEQEEMQEQKASEELKQPHFSNSDSESEKGLELNVDPDSNSVLDSTDFSDNISNSNFNEISDGCSDNIPDSQEISVSEPSLISDELSWTVLQSDWKQETASLTLFRNALPSPFSSENSGVFRQNDSDKISGQFLSDSNACSESNSFFKSETFFDGNSPLFWELRGKNGPFFSGSFDWQIQRNGQTLSQTSPWTQNCDVCDKRTAYIEWECSLQEGVTLQRTFLLAKEEQLLLALDVFLSPVFSDNKKQCSNKKQPLKTQKKLCFDWNWSLRTPLFPNVRIQKKISSENQKRNISEFSDESSEKCSEKFFNNIIFQTDSLHPVSLGRLIPFGNGPTCFSSHSASEKSFFCSSQKGQGTNFFVPFLFDLKPSRFRSPVRIYPLTVGENLQKVENDVAQGFRIQIQNDQFLLYRSFNGYINRTVLGHNLKSEFFFSRFVPHEKMNPFVEVSDE